MFLVCRFLILRVPDSSQLGAFYYSMIILTPHLFSSKGRKQYDDEARQNEPAYRIALSSLRLTHPEPLTAYMVRHIRKRT